MHEMHLGGLSNSKTSPCRNCRLPSPELPFVAAGGRRLMRSRGIENLFPPAPPGIPNNGGS